MRSAARRRPAPGAPSPSPVRRRAGVSLVEVIVAVAILAGALLAMGHLTGQLGRTVTLTDLRAQAAEVAAERLETVKSATSFDAIDSLYAEPTPRVVGGRPRFRRQTLIRRVGGGSGDLVDYKVITVVVTAARLTTAVRRTTVIGDF